MPVQKLDGCNPQPLALCIPIARLDALSEPSVRCVGQAPTSPVPLLLPTVVMRPWRPGAPVRFRKEHFLEPSPTAGLVRSWAAPSHQEAPVWLYIYEVSSLQDMVAQALRMVDEC